MRPVHNGPPFMPQCFDGPPRPPLRLDSSAEGEADGDAQDLPLRISQLAQESGADLPALSILEYVAQAANNIADNLGDWPPSPDRLAQLPAHDLGVLLNNYSILEESPAYQEFPAKARLLSSLVALLEEDPLVDEIRAAEDGDDPHWRQEFPQKCLRCGAAAGWRQVLFPPTNMPWEMRWRYARPENHVPLCKKCVRLAAWQRDPEQSAALTALGLWGPRFEALVAWQEGWKNGTLPADWDRLDYPLWPPQYGGNDWAHGCGCADDAPAGLPQGVVHTAEHWQALRQGIMGIDSTWRSALADPAVYSVPRGTRRTIAARMPRLKRRPSQGHNLPGTQS